MLTIPSATALRKAAMALSRVGNPPRPVPPLTRDTASTIIELNISYQSKRKDERVEHSYPTTTRHHVPSGRGARQGDVRDDRRQTSSRDDRGSIVRGRGVGSKDDGSLGDGGLSISGDQRSGDVLGGTGGGDVERLSTYGSRDIEPIPDASGSFGGRRPRFVCDDRWKMLSKEPQLPRVRRTRILPETTQRKHWRHGSVISSLFSTAGMYADKSYNSRSYCSNSRINMANSSPDVKRGKVEVPSTLLGSLPKRRSEREETGTGREDSNKASQWDPRIVLSNPYPQRAGKNARPTGALQAHPPPPRSSSPRPSLPLSLIALLRYMAPPGWTALDQQEWLEERNDDAIEARRVGKYSSWLIAIFHDWFLRWSEREKLYGPEAGILTPEQEAELAAATARRQSQIRNWFHNNRNKRFVKGAPRGKAQHVAGHTGPSTSAIRAELATGKASRAPQQREVYCRMFYDEDQKAAVAKQLAAERAELGRDLTRSETMRISRGHIDTQFQQVSDEVREQIKAKVEEVKAARKATPPPADPSRQRTPQEYQNAIDGAPKSITKYFETVVLETGWSFTVLGAGPSPRHGGAIKSFGVHFGTNASGHMLDEATENYQEKFVQPMVRFAKGVYPRDVRTLRALPASTYQDGDEMMMLIPPRGESTRSDTVTPSASVLPISDSASPQTTSQAVRGPSATIPAATMPSVSAPSQAQVLGDPANTPMAFDPNWSMNMSMVSTSQNLFDIDGNVVGMGEWDIPSFTSFTNATQPSQVPPIPIPPITQDLLDIDIPLPSTFSMAASAAPAPATPSALSAAPAPTMPSALSFPPSAAPAPATPSTNSADAHCT
ncbi:hypothetical protein L226DRAFT_525851 [Lentinus tigrinus ALCF2SS1-7]|uniref:uncharacterized protein n=1 Tax=Lentinus tigrinus ALCF2SS1-7 TaxID=1328758 RepID=UPI001165E3EA|nr:hypothetical protein L226DRAFT_525851 [Lentinus tigrinus ALCF2SS1-7]